MIFEHCVKSNKTIPEFIKDWVDDFEIHQGKLELTLEMMNSNTYHILSGLCSEIKCLSVPNILADQGKLDVIRSSASISILNNQSLDETNVFEWDVNLSNKSNNVGKMMNTVFEVDKEDYTSEAAGKRTEATKMIRSLVTNFINKVSFKGSID